MEIESPKIELEVCVDSLEKATIAEQSGASRIELCRDLSCGGLTPSQDLIAACVSHLSIPIHVLIRTRSGDFVYNSNEVAAMIREIEACKFLGAKGVVWGCLTHRREYDRATARILMEASKGLSVTFHKAIDESVDPLALLDCLVEESFDRVLTSGGKATAQEGADMLAEMVRRADNRLIVMGAGSVRSENIAQLARHTRAVSWHAAFGKEGIETSREKEQMQQDIRTSLELLRSEFLAR